MAEILCGGMIEQCYTICITFTKSEFFIVLFLFEEYDDGKLIVVAAYECGEQRNTGYLRKEKKVCVEVKNHPGWGVCWR